VCWCEARNFGCGYVRIGKHIVQFNMWDKKKKCQWALLVVYGPPHDELKDKFSS
jgi:hypothetical protein